MNKKLIINKTAQYAKKTLAKDASGHDWWHIYHVWKIAIRIGQKEKADLFIVELTALLHDIADWKSYGNDSNIGPKKAKQWLTKLRLDKNIIDQICEIIKNMSFKGASVKSEMKSIEGKIVQDADRLDALGAIGIARTFATGAVHNQLIYNPSISIKKRVNDLRIKNSYSSIHHFYDKILKLKSLMNTKTGKKLVKSRHDFIVKYLNEFFQEWDGKK